MATERIQSEPPLIVITGPTASGKTALAVGLAEKYGGEIICADSRTVYRDMDIGTAKPTPGERKRVPHWGLDILDPGARFTAADFQVYATNKINEIRARGNIPFLVGGTGLYIDAVVLDYQFGADADLHQRERLQAMSLDELHEFCRNNNIKLPENYKNKRYVIRTIEQMNINDKRRGEPIAHSIVVGIATERDILRTRIERRNEQIFDSGVVEEAKKLGNKYGWDSEAMTGNIYPIIKTYLDGKVTLEEAKRQSAIRDWRLAKRQLTWLKRDTFILWMTTEDASNYLSQQLEKWHKS